MAKALYGHLARPAIEAQLVGEIARLRARVAQLEAENYRLTEALTTLEADRLTGLDSARLCPPDLTDLVDLTDPAFA